MSNWILCSDEQPSEDGEYIITNRFGEVTIADYYDGWNNYRKNDGTICRTYQSEPGIVVAWQPLPAPYKKEA